MHVCDGGSLFTFLFYYSPFPSGMPNLGDLNEDDLLRFRRYYLTQRRTLSANVESIDDGGSSEPAIGCRSRNSSSTESFVEESVWYGQPTLRREYGDVPRNRHVLDFAFSTAGNITGFERFFLKAYQGLQRVLEEGTAAQVQTVFAPPGDSVARVNTFAGIRYTSYRDS